MEEVSPIRSDGDDGKIRTHGWEWDVIDEQL